MTLAKNPSEVSMIRAGLEIYQEIPVDRIGEIVDHWKNLTDHRIVPG